MDALMATLLVVDDDQIVRDLVSKGLGAHGYKVLTAVGGNPAFDIIRTQPIDAVITAVEMVDGNGAVLLKRIKSLPDRNLYVIFMAGLAEISLDQAYKLGAEAVFIKPFSNKDLINHLDNILKSTGDPKQRTPSRLKVGRGIEIGAYEIGSGKRIELRDIGIGGYSVIETGKLPQVDDVIPFTIQLKGDLFITFKGTGVVKWVNPTPTREKPISYGVEFQDFDMANSLKVTELVNFLKTKQLFPKA